MKLKIIVSVITISLLVTMSAWGQTNVIKRQTQKGRTTESVQLTPLEKKIVGKHLYGANFLFDESTGDGLGTLTITKQKNGKLRCKGSHRSIDHLNSKLGYGYVNLDGYIEIINANTLVFVGTINYNIPAYKTGDASCTGRYIFRGDDRVYWRQYDEDGYSKDYGGSYLDIFKKIMK